MYYKLNFYKNQFPMVYKIKGSEMTMAHYSEINVGDSFLSQRTRGLLLTVERVEEKRKARGVWKDETPDFFRVTFSERIAENKELAEMVFANDLPLLEEK